MEFVFIGNISALSQVQNEDRRIQMRYPRSALLSDILWDTVAPIGPLVKVPFSTTGSSFPFSFAPWIVILGNEV